MIFRTSSKNFKKIPGNPIAYWIGQNAMRAFENGQTIGMLSTTRKGMATGLNAEFVRGWNEVSFKRIGCGLSRQQAKASVHKWFPYANGGEYRKWYGNYNYIVNWENDGVRLQTEMHESGRVRAVNLNLDYIFIEGLSWTSIFSSSFSIRYLPFGFLFSSASNALFSGQDTNLFLGLLNSKVYSLYSKIFNPTLNANPGDIGKIPLSSSHKFNQKLIKLVLQVSRIDWNSSETSWDFTTLPILLSDYRLTSLFETYTKLRSHWLENTFEMQRLEEENNRIFIDAYGLQEELTPEVPLSEITLTCNPHYRYKGDKTEAELETRLLGDTIKEFISYAVGCMLGRYSLDKPGLILANQGETIEDYLTQIPTPSFSPDADNVIPILDGDWFSDDVTERFFKFLHVTFGDEHYEENLQFIENAIGKSIRKYFLKDFYNNHVRRYKKRPIYWMFGSPKGSFNVLIYMHRYRPDTVSVILNGYLREFRAKLNAKLTHLEKVGIGSDSSRSEKAKAIKEIEKLKKIITEVEDYERDILYPLATKQVEIDLDDGVKVNYNKFGSALKKITGLTGKVE